MCMCVCSGEDDSGLISSHPCPLSLSLPRPPPQNSGVLAVWSAKAGASKVLAVEYTDMAKHARTIVQRNGVANVVEVRFFFTRVSIALVCCVCGWMNRPDCSQISRADATVY